MHRGEDMLPLGDGSWESDESMVDMVGASASVDASSMEEPSTKKVKVVVEEPSTDHEEYTSNKSICKHCGKEFKSGKALGGHLRIHSQQFQAAASASLSTRRKKKKHPQRQDQDQDDCVFACFVCGESFESIRLLCQHKRNHREDDHHHKDNDSNTTKDDDDQQQPTLSEESSFLRKPTAEEENTNTNGDQEYYYSSGSGDDQNKKQNQGCGGDEHLLNSLPKWGRKRSRGTTSADDKVYDAMPLRFYYGPEVAESERKLLLSTRMMKKLKNSPDEEDASVEYNHSHQSHPDHDSESTVVELFGVRLKKSNGTTPNSILMPSDKSGEQWKQEKKKVEEG